MKNLNVETGNIIDLRAHDIREISRRITAKIPYNVQRDAARELVDMAISLLLDVEEARHDTLQ